jgi:hypothetical protein
MNIADIQVMISATIEQTVTAILDKLGLVPKSKPKRKPAPAPRVTDLEQVQEDFVRILASGTYNRETREINLTQWSRF